MANIFCALGCAPASILYTFPSRKYDGKRRKAWLNFFDMEEPNIDQIFVCNRHFSHLQTVGKSLRTTAVPDIPIICEGAVLHFRRKPKNWRKNVVVVTPRDPEFIIYRRETGVFPQKLFHIPDVDQPKIQVPVIKSVSCSMSTQTDVRLCGLVEILDINEEYRLNCFYCSETFTIEKWAKFVNHLRNFHFKKEEAFKMVNYVSHDHDYTSLKTPAIAPPVQSLISLNVIANPLIQLQPTQPVFIDPIALPSLVLKPLKDNDKPSQNLKSPPPLLANPQQSNNKSLDISLADRLIKMLNETVLSPNFLSTEEDNILVIKNTGSDSNETSTFLTNFMNSESSVAAEKPEFISKPKDRFSSTLAPKGTRSVYTINNGMKHVPSRRNSLSCDFFPRFPTNKRAKTIAKQTLKKIDFFENVYKTVKTRYPRAVELAKDVKSSKISERRNSNSTPLSRYLKRTITEGTPKVQKSTEIVFEYTPKDIVVSLLENMKNYPVLWEFHDQPFNKDYNKAINELCQIVNQKWSLNITLLKMRRSLNRILKFYRFMLSYESIDEFEDYFDKCAMFLPSSVDEIPRARCAYCYICYKKESELRKHIKERHKSLKWPYKCQDCLERFRESDEYELHKRLPHYEEIFKCDHCDRRFNRRHLYTKHVAALHQRSKQRMMRAENPVPRSQIYTCKVCKQVFESVGKYYSHKFSHAPEIIKCQLCSKRFCSNSSLRMHLKRHSNEFDFICEVCGKGFLRQAYLNDHMVTHTGAKITCRICNLKLRKNNLLRHLRLVHVATEGTVESAFRAKSYRYKKFLFPEIKRKRRRGNLPRQYHCKICKIQFNGLKPLKDHNKLVHHDVVKTPCKICNVEFKHIHNAKRHYREKHKLHSYQIFKLVDCNEDLNTVLAMTAEELESMSHLEYPPYSMINRDNKESNKLNYSQDESNFEDERIHADNIQDEIMKAVENIDKEEIIVDDDYSSLFTDLFNQS